jgi:C-terminal processing protease CtpA/Prc
VAAPQELARRLTSDLYAVTHDKHLAVTVVAPAARQPGSAPTRAEAARRDNGGVRRVELLAGNVGYVDIRFFWRLDEAQAAVDAAMQLLARADAVIFDMRNNSGGSPETVARVLSYLFDGAPTVLFEITPRTGAPTRYATTPVDGRNGRRPLYVLTSTRSFSGGEGFAFILQDRGRAEVIGEPTAGAANPGRPYPVNDLFAVVVPNGRLLTVPSGRNWEGSGVRPDVSSPADETVRVAHERALRRLIAEAKGPADRQQYEQALQSLSSPR